MTQIRENDAAASGDRMSPERRTVILNEAILNEAILNDGGLMPADDGWRRTAAYCPIQGKATR